MTVDRYGFFISEEEAARRAPSLKKLLKLEASRHVKWHQMMSKWAWYVEHKADKIKQRIRKGIPNTCRAQVWQVLSGALELRARNRGAYQELLSATHTPHLSTIKRDLMRTFPTHHLFAEEDTPGQRSLLNVLRAYSVYDNEIGYCQGMAFLAGVLLNYMPEEVRVGCCCCGPCPSAMRHTVCSRFSARVGCSHHTGGVLDLCVHVDHLRVRWDVPARAPTLSIADVPVRHVAEALFPEAEEAPGGRRRCLVHVFLAVVHYDVFIRLPV